jgi:hypothetical protein
LTKSLHGDRASLRLLENFEAIVRVWAWRNALGATGGGAYFYITPTVDLLTGPVFFFDNELQPGQASMLWSVQVDIDIDLNGGK